MKWNWRRWSLNNKLLLFYMPLIVLPIVCGMYFITSNFNDTSRKIMKQNTEDLLDLVVERLDQEFYRFEEMSLQFFVDADLQRLLQEPADTYLQVAKVKTELDRRIQILIGNFRPYVMHAVVSWKDQQYVFGRKNGENVRRHHSDFVSKIAESDGVVLWDMQATDERGKRVILLGRNINHLDRYNKIGEILFVIDPDIFRHVLQETKISKNAQFELYSEELIVQAGIPQLADNTVPQLKIEVDSHQYDWTLRTIIPLQQLNDQIAKSAYMSIIVTILCVVLGLAVTQVIAMDMIIPIKKLMKNMKQGVKGIEPKQLLRFRGAKEVTELNDTFISVLYEIQQLNQEVLSTQQKKQDSEIRVLQNQLSPHFLYNTLNTIRWMAIIQKQDNIKEIADSLSSLLSYSLRDLGELVQLKDELTVLDAYIKIQKVRYQDFTLTIELPEHMEQLYVMKLLLQPIVENAVLHGISQISHNGVLTVQGFELEGRLHLIVRDNGCGMSKERLTLVRTILQGDQERRHLGLKNIHDRIQLHYGQSYGLRVDSIEGEGTMVELILPWLEHKENKENKKQ